MRFAAGKPFLLGALIGDLFAAITGILLFLPFPFSHALHLALITVGFWLSPFYLLEFMTIVHSSGAVVAIAFVGNAVLYGGIALLGRFVYKLLWR